MKTELVMILDRSGSMTGLEKDTIGGYNSMLERQKQAPGEAIVSTVLFDHEIKIIHNRVNIKNVNPMTKKDYYPRGTTALLDCIGTSIKHIKRVHKQTLRKYRPDKTIFVIITDGYENASKHYRYEDIKRLINRQKEYGWEFLFLGANIDAIGTASQFGIDENRAVNFHSDKRGIDINYRTISKTIEVMRMSGDIPDNWKEDIEQDFHSR